MYEVIHKTQGIGERSKYKYVDIYVKDYAEALGINTKKMIQGSKLYIVEAAELFVLNEDDGAWRSVTDGSILA